jgi:hypothetical protein
MREGPVTFNELKIKIGNYMLRPPVEMVWTEAQGDWKSVAEVPELARARGAPLPAGSREAGKDEWFYLEGGQPIGPLELAKMRGRILDETVEPPVQMVWTSGMDRWLPVFEVPALCEPIPGPTHGHHVNGAANGQKNAEPPDTEEARTAARNARLTIAAAAEARAAIKERAEDEARRMAAAVTADEVKPKAPVDLNRPAAGQEFRPEIAPVRSPDEARLKVEQQARIEQESRARAEHKASGETQEAESFRLAAKARAIADKAKLEQEMRGMFAEEARAEAEALAQAEGEAKFNAESEAHARTQEEAKRRLAEIARAAAAVAKMEQEIRLKAAETVKAEA